jgi:16S rRNA processing protein RimM
MVEGAYLAVARVRKPHGLKGDLVVWVLTDDPDHVLSPGRRLTHVDEQGQPIDEALVIERSRSYHRQWLLKFEGERDRPTLDTWKERVFGVPEAELDPPTNDEMYEHEIPGVDVVVDSVVVGKALDLVRVPTGMLLEVQIDERTVLIPFKKPIVKLVDRRRRVIELDPPDGLLEL